MRCVASLSLCDLLHTHNFILIDFLIVGGAVDGVYSEVALQRKSRCMIIAEGTPSEWIKCVDMVPGPRDSIFFDRGWDCGWEYSEVESRKSDQNQHLEGGRVFGGSISFFSNLFFLQLF